MKLSRQKGDAAIEPDKGRLASLTEREHDVVRTLVVEPGADNKLAKRLRTGERNFLSRIYDKLEVPSRLELHLFAQKQSAALIGAAGAEHDA